MRPRGTQLDTVHTQNYVQAITDTGKMVYSFDAAEHVIQTSSLCGKYQEGSGRLN